MAKGLVPIIQHHFPKSDLLVVDSRNAGNGNETAESDATLTPTYREEFLPVPSDGGRCPVSGLTHGRFDVKVSYGPGRRHLRIVDRREPGQTRASKLHHASDRWLDHLARVLAVKLGK